MKAIGQVLVEISERIKHIEDEKERNKIINKEIFSYINNYELRLDMER